MAVSSDDTNDDVGGTGATQITITGLDGNHEEIVENVTMDGTTPVNTVNTFLRINSVLVTAAGSSKVNEGTISLLNGADNLAQILPLNGNSLQLVFTVPAGRTWFSGTLTPFTGRDDEVTLFGETILPSGTSFVFSNTFFYQNGFYFKNFNKFPFAEKWDFELTAKKTGAAGNSKIAIIQENS